MFKFILEIIFIILFIISFVFNIIVNSWFFAILEFAIIVIATINCIFTYKDYKKKGHTVNEKTSKKKEESKSE